MKHLPRTLLLLLPLLLVSCTADSSRIEQILDEISRRRAALEEVHITYHATVEHYTQNSPAALAEPHPQLPELSSDITTFSVTYTRKGNQSRFIHDQCDADGNCTQQDATWTDKGTSAFASILRARKTPSLYNPQPGAPDDLPTLSLLEYWMYIGFTPKWLMLDDVYDIEYNIPRHFHDQATTVYDDKTSTLTYQGRFIYVFDSFQLVTFKRLSRKGGPVTLCVRYTYDQKIGPIFPAQVVAETFDSTGTIETRKTITVTELETNLPASSTLSPHAKNP